MPLKKIISSESPPSLSLLSPFKMLAHLFSYRQLILQFTRREVVGRYRGTYLGLFWSLLSPLMTLAVYTFVFGFILKARFTSMHGTGEGHYALTLFSGIITYNIFSRSISGSPNQISSKPSYVKKVVFPLEILPVAALLGSLIHAMMALCILIVCLLLFSSNLEYTMLLYPLILVPTCALTLGLSWFLSSIGVFIRDISQALNVLLHLLFFISPIIYPLDAIPDRYQLITRINPLTTILENARKTLIWGEAPEWIWIVAVTLFSLILMQIGYVIFMKTKRYFPDFL